MIPDRAPPRRRLGRDAIAVTIRTMSQYLQIHPSTPQPRLIQRVVEMLRAGGVIAYPTDSCYALGCTIGNKEAMQRIGRMRGADRGITFTLICRDLSEIATYARVDNAAYRFLRAHTPGPYTFILKATREVPKRLQAPSRRTIGIRVPDHAIPRALVEVLGEPLMSSTLHLRGDALPLSDPYEIRERLEHEVEAVVDGGACGLEPTTVVDLSGDTPRLVRAGKGALAVTEASP
jgi:tRNA threonylcarbamoyl adenosine modification protein (Sua5/YciO/YrdC/YwlC family)